MNWLTGIFRRRQLYDELSEEIRLHLDERTEQLMREGMSRRQAEEAARRAFGNATLLEERSREVWQWPTIESILADGRFALRQLRRSPGFAVSALLIVGMGIGASTAVFSIVDSVLLRPFAFREPGQLMVWRETIQEVSKRYPLLPDNYRHFLYFRAHSTTVADAALLRNTSFAVSIGQDHPQMLDGLSVSPNFFSVLGVAPILGRGFTPDKAAAGNRSVVIAWPLWQRLFRGDPNVIGRTLRIKGEQRTVVGVLPRTFDFPNMHEMPGTAPGKSSAYEVFEPFVPQTDDLTSDDGNFACLVIARLKAGVSAKQATSELDGMAKAYGLSNRLPIHLGVFVEPLSKEVTGKVGKALWLLLGAVMGLLLIACVNLASLQLARSVERERDHALRSALGAGRLRLLRASLVESFVLAAAGGAAGILLAFTGVHLFIAMAPADIPRLNEIQMSWQVLMFAAAVCLLTALLSGSLPALRSFKSIPQQALKPVGTRATSGRRIAASRRWLVAFEIAGTTVLLILTSLVARSFSRVLNQELSFNAQHLLVAQVDLLSLRYEDGKDCGAEARTEFIERAMDRLRANSGVDAVAMTSAMPLTGDDFIHGIYRPDYPLPESEVVNANVRNISPGYFAAMQTPLVAGQEFDARELEHPEDAIVSQRAAREAWPNIQSLGKRFKIDGRIYKVIGVAADARIADLKEDPPVVYLPYSHDPPGSVFFLVRSSLPPDALARTIQHEIWDIDREVAIPVIKSLDRQLTESVSTERLQAFVLSAFGAAALALAVLGVYGVLTYSVSLRKPEFGIRLALGSSKASLTRLVLWDACVPVAAGVILGLAVAMAATRAIQSLLYETQAGDPASIAASLALLLAATFPAAFLPAYRASNTDPMRVLREQ